MSSIKGGKKKRRGKNLNNIQIGFNEPTEGQYFAKAIRPLGSFKVEVEVYFYTIIKHNKGTKQEKEVITFNKETKIGSVRGKMRRREYVNPGCIVLVSEREFSNDANIVDIIYLYKPYHINQIKKHRLVPGEIIFSTKESADDIDFELTDEEDSNEESITSGYISKNKIQTSNKSQKYNDIFSEMNLPNFSDEEEQIETREQDEFGNYI